MKKGPEKCPGLKVGRGGGEGAGGESRREIKGKIKFSLQSNDSYHKRKKKLLKLTMGSRKEDF